jgi:hypothetical protein
MNNDLTPGLKRFHAPSLVCLDLIVGATNVGPIVRGKPANRQAVDEYVRFLSQIEHRSRTARAPQQELKTVVGEFSSAGSTEISQAVVGGNLLAALRFKVIVSRAEVPRQTLS